MRKVLWVIPLLFLLSCAKEKEGAVQFRAQTRGNYTYTNFYVGLAYRQYGDPYKTASATDVTKTVRLSSVPDGKYYWFAGISYSGNGGIGGSKSFGGDVVIEKGKVKDILIEVD
jgi:hypothetical protein